jgi:cytochrome c553
VFAALFLASAAGAQDLDNGAAQFEACTSCHGVSAAGNLDFSAPAIAALPSWYVEAQLGKFRSGARGAHPGDYDGLRMRPMSRYLRTEADIKDVAAYVASLAPVSPEASFEADAEKGKTLYTQCIPCHGVDGAGSEVLGGPPLRHQSDWYLVSAIEKFRDGLRGADPDDSTGALMRAMAMAKELASDEAINDVVAYIRTLGD